MDELISQVIAVAKGMWKHRWLGMLAAWMVAIVGTIAVFRVPDRYEASARIYVDTQSILKPLMSGLAVQPNVEQQIAMLSRTLISRPNVERLVRMADLDLANNSKAEQERTIDAVTKGIAVRSTGRDNLYTLSFSDGNPEKAKRVVQSLVSIFIESSLGDSRKDSDTAKRFLNDQIKTYESKLEEAESRLKEFKLRNIEVNTADGGDGVSRIAALSAQLQTAQLELKEAENARDAAKRQLDAEKSTTSSDASRSILQQSALAVSTPEIDSRIEAQKRNLDGLLQRYTEQHPDVVGARRLIRDLEDQKKKEVQDLIKMNGSSPMQAAGGPASPAALELSRMMASSEVQVAALRARVAEYSARYARAREMMRSAPQTETELMQLNRDYAIHKKNYEDLVARRESASLSGELESAAGIADFRLIDPPRASNAPVSPNRLLLLIGALGAALGAGLFVPFVVSQLRPVFHDSRSLRNAVELPLLGVVTLVVTESFRQKKHSDLRRFALASSGLVGIFVAGVAVVFLFARQVG